MIREGGGCGRGGLVRRENRYLGVEAGLTRYLRKWQVDGFVRADICHICNIISTLHLCVVIVKERSLLVVYGT